MGDLGEPEAAAAAAGPLEGASEKERLLGVDGMPVLDFDVLCATVALQTQGKWSMLDLNGGGPEERLHENSAAECGPGVLRMWEGQVLDCFDDHRIALESVCCPCYRFGKNMRRAGFGPCFLQAAVYCILAAGAISNSIAFVVTRRRCFLYLAIAFTISVATYLGFFRTRIKKKFNIRDSDSAPDDCIYHLVCPCCTLCQESRTMEMNNVQDGTWHGRGDTICIGGYGEGSKALFELHPPSIVSMKSGDH